MHSEAVDRHLKQAFAIQLQQLETLEATMATLQQALTAQDHHRIASLSQEQAEIAQAIDAVQTTLKRALMDANFEATESHIKTYCIKHNDAELRQLYAGLRTRLQHSQSANLRNHVLSRKQLTHCDDVLQKMQALGLPASLPRRRRQDLAYGKNGTIEGETPKQLLCRA